jgi:hypothetical protein
MKTALFCTALVSMSLALADTLHLRDGRTVRGTFISGNSREIRFLAEGGRSQRYQISAVERLTFGNTVQNGERTRTSEVVVPAGTTVTVRLLDSIDSNETDVGRTYRASLDDPIVINGRAVVQQGANATVQVVRVDQAGTVSGREEIALVLAEIVAGGRRVTVPQSHHAEVAAKSRSQESAKVIGGTAVVGAIIGAIAGGGKGAAIGAASGAGAGVAIQAIRGQRIRIPAETKLDFTLAQPLRM